MQRAFRTQGRTRTDTGLTPMVFETIASTNSATWADYHQRESTFNECFHNDNFTFLKSNANVGSRDWLIKFFVLFCVKDYDKHE